MCDLRNCVKNKTKAIEFLETGSPNIQTNNLKKKTKKKKDFVSMIVIIVLRIVGITRVQNVAICLTQIVVLMPELMLS